MSDEKPGLLEAIIAWFKPKEEKSKDTESTAERLEKAIERDKAQHRQLIQQVATIMGSAKKMRIKLDEKQNEIEILTKKIKTAVAYQTEFISSGDTGRAEQFAQIARTLAAELLGIQSDYANLEQLANQADTAASNAKRKAEESKGNLRTLSIRHERLRNQLAQADLQRTIADSYRAALALPGATGEEAVPSLVQVEDEIRTKYTTALSEVELAQELEPANNSTAVLDSLTVGLDVEDLIEQLSDPTQLPPVRRDRVNTLMRELEARDYSG